MALAFVFIQMASAVPRYVDKYGTNPTPDYISWETAATNIQDAVNVAIGGETVWVSNGVYDAGGKITPSYELTNRVCATTAIILRSVNGPAYTSIKGQSSPNGLMGTGAVRCVYLSGGASLIGFALTNGYTMTNSVAIYDVYDKGGAGVLVVSSGCVSNCIIVGNFGCQGGSGASIRNGGSINNCIISNNNANTYGGGVRLHGSTAQMNDCLVVNNIASNCGGGVCMESGSLMRNCLIAGNISKEGGGVWIWGIASSIRIDSCTIVGNVDYKTSGSGGGGGVYAYNSANNSLTNCIVWGNTATAGTGSNICLSTSTQTYTHVCSGPVQTGIANIGSDPIFVGVDNGNYRLRMRSPCVNTGTNQNWMTNAVDLEGNARILSSIVDMGAYETLLWQGTIYRIP